ncbi:unnamed protein product, partial [Tetraodon nigroviridis]
MYIRQEQAGVVEPRAKRWKGPGCVAEDSWEAYPVLSDEQSQDVELVEAFAAPILDKKETSRLVRELNAAHPFHGLQHLKRDAPGTEAALSLHSLLSGAVGAAGLGPPFVVKVPARAPLTRPQFEL